MNVHGTFSTEDPHLLAQLSQLADAPVTLAEVESIVPPREPYEY